jgi:hypothetical protein
MERRRSAIYLIIGISLLSGLITGRTFFFNVTYAFGGLLLLSFLWAWNGANWLRLTRQTRARRAQVGRYMEERFTIRNTSVLPKLWLEIYDHSGLPGHRASHGQQPRTSIIHYPVGTNTVRQAASFCFSCASSPAPFGIFEIEQGPHLRFCVLPGCCPAAMRPPPHPLHHHQRIGDYVPEIASAVSTGAARRDRLVVKEFGRPAGRYLTPRTPSAPSMREYNPTDIDADKMPWEINQRSLFHRQLRNMR